MSSETKLFWALWVWILLLSSYLFGQWAGATAHDPSFRPQNGLVVAIVFAIADALSLVVIGAFMLGRNTRA